MERQRWLDHRCRPSGLAGQTRPLGADRGSLRDLIRELWRNPGRGGPGAAAILTLTATVLSLQLLLPAGAVPGMEAGPSSFCRS
jgi:hypothetical protein